MKTTDPTHRSATVNVYTPCTCSACSNPATPWFRCGRLAARMVARYACDGHEDAPSTPCDHALAAMTAAHPGMVLVY